MKTTAEKTAHTQPTRQGHDTQERAHQLFIPPSVQPKLTVNTPGDPYEQEADAVAEQVMSRAASPQMKEAPSLRRQGEQEEELQRQCTDCEEEAQVQRQEVEEEEEMVQRQPSAEEEEVQRQCTDCEEEELQRSPNGDGGTGGRGAPPIVSEVVSSGGKPMDKGARGFMEYRFGADFSHVQIHEDDKAQRSASAISAEAYTYGSHIVFARGKYEPESQRGKHLLAHELTHVLQQDKSVKRRIDPAANANPATESNAPLPNAAGPPPIQAEAQPASAGPSPIPAGAEAPAPPASSLPTVAELEPLMPPPPEALGPEAQARLRQSQRNAGTAAEANADMPAAEELTSDARSGVTEPEVETGARASGQLTASMGERLAPSPEIEALCEDIRRVIREKRPPDEDSLLQADPEEAAQEAGTQLNDNIDSDVERVEGEYDELDESPTGEAEQVGAEIVLPPEEVGEPNLRAAGAAPDPLTEEDVSLDADVEASAQQMEEAGMTTPVAEVIEDGPVAESRAVHEELETTAAEDPALVLAEQDLAIAGAQADMEMLQAQALQALESARTGTVRTSGSQQTDMVGSEEEQRAALGAQAEEIFTNAQTQVNDLLAPLTDTAMQMWEAGKARVAWEFERHLARVQRWVDERYSGAGGGIVELWDDLTGMPGWVTDEYDDAERSFGDDICDLIREISLHVNGIIVTCEEIIDTADRDINDLFDSAPAELAEWAAAERERFQGRLDGLREEVSSTQQSFNEDLANRAAQAVQEVREQVHALREAAKGLLGQIADAITEFLEDPIRAIINGLLRLVGIEPAAFWALAARIEQVMEDIANDPLGFASNLMAAIGQGFDNFFNNFFTHLFDGFINWIFSGLGAVGVEIPKDLSLSGIITFFLQLMGITWERIRMLLARHIGEENVALLEQAYEIITDLIELGPQGVFELIKDQLDPQSILDQVIEMAVDFVVETLIKQATIRIAMLFNPVGAIAQAIEAIYRVLSWIFENAARIFTLVETVINGIADIVAGNIAGMAATVENALTQILVPVIDFVAGYMGLGGLPERVADMVRGLQNWIEGILDRVIGWLAAQARSILSALGISEDADPEGEEEGLEDTTVGEEVRFRAGGEQHKIWITVNGGREELMVASDSPMALSQRLDNWERDLAIIPQERRSEVQSLLSTVRTDYGLVLEESEKANDAIEQARERPNAENIANANSQDEQVEALQRGMTPELGRLFDLFEGGVAFNPVQKQVSVAGTNFEIVVLAGGANKLAVHLEGVEIIRQFSGLQRGPFGAAHHRDGLTMVRQAMVAVMPINNEIKAIQLRNGKLPSAVHLGLESQLTQIVNAISGFADAKPKSWQHLLTSPPMHEIDNVEVPFGQQLGNESAIINEYDRQLGLQQSGINRLSVDQWILNRNAYSLNDNTFLQLDAEQRRATLAELRRRAEGARNRARRGKQRYMDAIAAIEDAFLPQNLENPDYSPDFSDIEKVTGRFGNEGSWRRKRRSEINQILVDLRADFDDWDLVFSRAAVLHNADQIAGGFGEIPDIERVTRPGPEDDDEAWKAYMRVLEQFVGSSNVNSSIGSLWRTNIAGLENSVRAGYKSQAWPIWKMNVTLRRV